MLNTENNRIGILDEKAGEDKCYGKHFELAMRGPCQYIHRKITIEYRYQKAVLFTRRSLSLNDAGDRDLPHYTYRAGETTALAILSLHD